MTTGDLLRQLVQMLLMAVPVACISWTVTHEEVFREPREFCRQRSEQAGSIAVRKFFYVFTCEYCFSHWITLGVLAVTGFRLIYDDWRGIIGAFFSLVWIANVYMSLFGRVRLEIKHERTEAAIAEARAKTITKTA